MYLLYKECSVKAWNFYGKSIPLKLLNKTLEKCLIFSKVAGSKNEITHTYFSRFLLKV